MVIRLISGNLGYNQFTHDTQFSSASLVHSEQGVFASIFQTTLRTTMLSLRERLHTHKVFTTDQCFYLYYHKFYIKSYVLDVY